jgi:hypothetical protein
MYEVVWLSPEGQLYDIETSHIDFVFDNPKIFGTTLGTLKKVYDEFGQRYGVEGPARDRIIEMISDKAWVRGRFQARMYYEFSSDTVETVKQNPGWKSLINTLLTVYSADTKVILWGVKEDHSEETTLGHC